MRAVLVEVPDSMVEERRRLGIDRFDELWSGVWHMVPPPGGRHQRLGTALLRALGPAADEENLLLSYETGLFRSADDYRVPDLIVYRHEQASDRGVDDSAELVIELRSPGDESYDKLEWYAGRGVKEVLVIEPDSRMIERFALRGDAHRLVEPTADGTVTSQVLRVAFRPVETPDGMRLSVRSGDHRHDC